MIEILQKQNIVPSTQEKYNATAIWLVVKTEIGSAPTISCVEDKVKIYEMQFSVSNINGCMIVVVFYRKLA